MERQKVTVITTPGSFAGTFYTERIGKKMIWNRYFLSSEDEENPADEPESTVVRSIEVVRLSEPKRGVARG